VVRTCRDSRDKEDQLKHILGRVPGSAIVYVRNRMRAEEISKALGVLYYHAGLSHEERSLRQEAWKAWRTDSQTPSARVMVCTNAFGMGIDKADVRLVIHYDLPDSPEAYFQEAGRAGRDGKPAYAVLLFADEDKAKVRKRISDNYPPREFVEKVYHAASDYFGVGLGSGLNHSFALHMDDLCRVMKLPILTTYSAMHLLTQAGYIYFEDEQETEARVKINIDREALGAYELGTAHKEMLQNLMRQHTGIFTDLQYLRFTPDEAQHRLLSELAARHIITYLPRTRACLFSFTRERQAEVWLPRSIYEQRQQQYAERLTAMLEYAENTRFCREQLLLHYFGEEQAPVCHSCDVCRAKKTL
jgi:ATP-dependent DNA helicase RecQ